MIHPLRDQLIVEPLDVVYSRRLIVKRDTRPLRGIVLAVGPGHYPLRYCSCESVCYGRVCNNPPKHQRRFTWNSKHFQPTEIKIGDVVELGSAQYVSELGAKSVEGYAFEMFWWGEKLCLHCREADVAIVREDLTADQAREEQRLLCA